MLAVAGGILLAVSVLAALRHTRGIMLLQLA
jgi:hypothetical protein